MTKLALSILLLFLCFQPCAQSKDFIILKKGKKNVKYFVAGNNIEYISQGEIVKKAHITLIENDTLYLREYILQKKVTMFGNTIEDTVGTMGKKIHYNQISGFPARHSKKFDWAASGGALLGGGTLLAAGSGISYIVAPKRTSPKLALASLAAMGLGYYLIKLSSKNIVLGKRKYRIEYVDL